MCSVRGFPFSLQVIRSILRDFIWDNRGECRKTCIWMISHSEAWSSSSVPHQSASGLSRTEQHWPGLAMPWPFAEQGWPCLYKSPYVSYQCRRGLNIADVQEWYAHLGLLFTLRVWTCSRGVRTHEGDIKYMHVVLVKGWLRIYELYIETVFVHVE